MLMLEFIRSYVTATFGVSITIIIITIIYISFQIINRPSDLWKYTLFV